MYFDEFLTNNNINKNDLTFTCAGPQEGEIVYCCELNVEKTVKIFSTVLENTTTSNAPNDQKLIELVTSNEVKQKIIKVLTQNILANSKKILNQYSDVITLSNKKSIMTKYTSDQIINAVTQYVLKCFDEDGVFNCITEYTFKNKFNWVTDSYDREMILDIADKYVLAV